MKKMLGLNTIRISLLILVAFALAIFTVAYGGNGDDIDTNTNLDTQKTKELRRGVLKTADELAELTKNERQYFDQLQTVWKRYSGLIPDAPAILYPGQLERYKDYFSDADRIVAESAIDNMLDNPPPN